jgi:hypothetical protein
MIGAASAHKPDMDEVTIPELQEQLEIANRKLIAARSSFEKACQPGNQSPMMSVLAEKQLDMQVLMQALICGNLSVNALAGKRLLIQVRMQEVLSLQKALVAKGIPQKDLSSGEWIKP